MASPGNEITTETEYIAHNVSSPIEVPEPVLILIINRYFERSLRCMSHHEVGAARRVSECCRGRRVLGASSRSVPGRCSCE